VNRPLYGDDGDALYEPPAYLLKCRISVLSFDKSPDAVLGRGINIIA